LSKSLFRLLSSDAALILHDDEVEITAENLEKLCHAAKVHMEPYWFGLFAKALGKADVASLIGSIGSASAGPAVAAAPAAGGAAAAGMSGSSRPSVCD
jgi:ribosomal protein L12E/L44/L45/RPP1/RPP2